MNARWSAIVAAVGLLAWSPPTAWARGLGVEVWTDRGDDAVYQPGQSMEIRTRASDDAYLLVYEIDAEGFVRLLYPYRGSSGFVEGRRTYPVPPERSNVDLVVQGPVGQCYVVAIAARDPFRELPGYLRPYDLQAEEVGYEGMSDDDEGITRDGRIVGDPFVAMERIRRRVLVDARDPDAFGTSYATYYVHNQVKYPRYLCYDCHRPGRWAWWSGFDPYYASCSVFDLRVNWSWGWGPGYWFGCVPYYNYVVRHDCPPRYMPYFQDHARFSSWDGWRRWDSMWGNRLVRFKSDPPSNHVPLPRFTDRGGRSDGKPIPPGFVAGDTRPGSHGQRPSPIIGRDAQTRPREPMPRENMPREHGPVWWRPGQGTDKPGVERMPSRQVIRDPEDGQVGPRGGAFRERGQVRSPRVEGTPSPEPPRYERPRDPGREPSPRYERPRDSGREASPRSERPRDSGRETSPRSERPRDARPAERPRDPRPAETERSSDAPRGGHRTRG